LSISHFPNGQYQIKVLCLNLQRKVVMPTMFRLQESYTYHLIQEEYLKDWQCRITFLDVWSMDFLRGGFVEDTVVDQLWSTSSSEFAIITSRGKTLNTILFLPIFHEFSEVYAATAWLGWPPSLSKVQADVRRNIRVNETKTQIC
jgi:hypothetical protein